MQYNTTRYYFILYNRCRGVAETTIVCIYKRGFRVDKRNFYNYIIQVGTYAQACRQQPYNSTMLNRMPCFISIADIESCAKSPCDNNGVCIDAAKGYTCTCVAGFEGTNCEIGNANAKLRHY